MSEASETARAELVAAEILQVWPELSDWILETRQYDLVAKLLALAYLRGRGDENAEYLATIARRGRGAS